MDTLVTESRKQKRYLPAIRIEFLQPEDGAFSHRLHDLTSDTGKQNFLKLVIWAAHNAVELRIRNA